MRSVQQRAPVNPTYSVRHGLTQGWPNRLKLKVGRAGFWTKQGLRRPTRLHSRRSPLRLRQPPARALPGMWARSAERSCRSRACCLSGRWTLLSWAARPRDVLHLANCLCRCMCSLMCRVWDLRLDRGLRVSVSCEMLVVRAV